MEPIYDEIIEKIKDRNPDKDEIRELKQEITVKHNQDDPPSNFDILLRAEEDDFEALREKLLSKPIRTASGVAPVAIMTKPHNCPHGQCTFCPGGVNSPYGDVPQSYTGEEPTTMRAIRNEYDPYLQVFNRLEQYVVTGHNFDKVELIIMGGTFPSLSKYYQNEFIAGAFQAMNDFSEMFYKENNKFDIKKFREFFELPGDLESEERKERIHSKLLDKKGELDLKEAKIKNEDSKVRCVALCIETKPDWAKLEEGNRMLKQGCTRVEVGVQTVYDEVLEEIHRGHDIEDTKESFRILKDLGFKVSAHYMPGLPSTTEKEDIQGFRKLFESSDFRPDMLKIYPCMVAPGTALYQQWKQGNFEPLTAEQAAERISKMKEYVPRYCRIQRIQRDVPTKEWAAGVEFTNLRQHIHQKYNPECECIRCREPAKGELSLENIGLNINQYKASKSQEYFISFNDNDNDTILGFSRLRFPSQQLREEITENSAMIRELHVYGQAAALNEEEGKVQHRGYGKKLMNKAEEIAKENNKEKILVISGVGVRNYYRKLGYEKDGPYMSKKLE